jgi:hypothetical protein
MKRKWMQTGHVAQMSHTRIKHSYRIFSGEHQKIITRPKKRCYVTGR